MANGLSGPFDPSQFSTTPLSGSIDPNQFSLSGPVYGPSPTPTVNPNNNSSSSGQGSIGPPAPSEIEQILAAVAANTAAIAKAAAAFNTNPNPTPKIDLSGVTIPTDLNTYAKQVTDPTTTEGQKFNAYYTQILTEAKGDLNEALRIMEYDYSTGGDRLKQATQLGTQRATEDLNSALQTLGIQFGKEKDTALDTLNKRGIAVTQAGGPGSASTKVAGTGNVTYDAQGNPTYSGQDGQAGTELSMLSEDQKLRQEAQTRTQQRTIQDLGIKQTQGLQDLTEQQTEATTKANRAFQTTQEQQQQQEQQDVLSRAQLLQSQAYQKAGVQLQEAQLKQSGGSVPSGYQTPT